MLQACFPFAAIRIVSKGNGFPIFLVIRVPPARLPLLPVDLNRFNLLAALNLIKTVLIFDQTAKIRLFYLIRLLNNILEFQVCLQIRLCLALISHY